MSDSPFLQIPESEWLCSNGLAFAVSDRYPVSPGHALVITKRLIPTWVEASTEEKLAIMELVDRLLSELGDELSPDGFNVGFNIGTHAGQTVPHLHVHVIPRFAGDVEDPTGGIRFVIPDKANYLT